MEKQKFTALSSKWPVNAAALKYIAVITMLIDHIGYGLYILPAVKSTYTILRAVGRNALPIFCFFLVEGFIHTSNRWKYLRNMLIFALISQVPYHYAFYRTKPWNYQFNIYCTLALGLVAVWLIEILMEKRKGIKGWALSGIIVAAITAIASIANVSYGWAGLLLIVIFYVFRRKPLVAMTAGYTLLIIYDRSEIYALSAFLLLLLYNGQRGKQNKWFFYAFYPAHLAVIAIIKTILWAQV